MNFKARPSIFRKVDLLRTLRLAIFSQFYKIELLKINFYEIYLTNLGRRLGLGPAGSALGQALARQRGPALSPFPEGQMASPSAKSSACKPYFGVPSPRAIEI